MFKTVTSYLSVSPGFTGVGDSTTDMSRSITMKDGGGTIGVTVIVAVGIGTGVSVGGGGTGVLVGGGTGVAVGGTGVLVGGTGVAVGGTGVLVGGTGVAVGGTGVSVGGGVTGVLVGVTLGGTDVLVAVGDGVGVIVKVAVGKGVFVGVEGDELLPPLPPPPPEVARTVSIPISIASELAPRSSTAMALNITSLPALSGASSSNVSVHWRPLCGPHSCLSINP